MTRREHAASVLAVILPAILLATLLMLAPGGPALAQEAGSPAASGGTIAGGPGGGSTVGGSAGGYSGAGLGLGAPLAGPISGRGLGDPGVANGTTIRLGDALGANEGTLAERPQILVIPAISGFEEYDSNVASFANGPSDFITEIAPSVTVRADTARINASISYSPVIAIYAEHGDQTYVAQNLNAGAQAVIIPDLLYVNAQAYAAVEPRNGGLGLGGIGGGIGGGGIGGFGGLGGFTNGYGYGASGNVGRNNANQVSSFSIEPYAVQRFSDIVTIKAGLELDETMGGNDYVTTAPTSSGVATTSDNQTTERESVEAVSGDVLGRFRDTLVLSATQYEGSGVNSGAYENYATDQLGYAVTHEATVFGEGGYEDIRYGTVPVTRIEDPVWSFGARAAPNPDSVIIAGYGHKFGFNAAFANANYNVTARTNIHGYYTSSLGTALGQLQGLVSGGSLDPNGGFVDSVSGAPLFITGGLLGYSGNSTLYRIKQLSAGVTTTYTRDVISLSLIQDERQAVGSSAPLALNPIVLNTLTERTGFFGAGHDLSAQVAWQHDLTPTTSVSSYAVYGISHEQGEPGHDTFIEFDATANMVLSDKLTGFIRYDYAERMSRIPGFSYDANVILVGLTRTF